MNKKQERHSIILDVLANLGLGVINISNEELSALVGCSKRTIANDLNELDNDKIIIRETNLIKSNGSTVKQRDIIIKGQKPRRFSLNQHRQLSDKNNHKIYTNKWGEIIWERRIDGVWQRAMKDKDFTSEQQAYSWLYPTLSQHHKKAIEGDKYIKR